MIKDMNLNLLQETRKCHLCGSEKFKNLWNDYCECLNCRCIYVPLVKEITCDKDYYYFDKINEINLKKRAKLLFKIFSKFKTKNAKQILDYGCGHGYFIKECLKNSLDAWGIDTSIFIKEKVESFLKNRIFLLNGNLKDIFFERNFDIIVLWDVVEHLLSPVRVLKELREILKPDGLIMISTPNINSLWGKVLKQEWHGFGIPQYHITYFDKATLRTTIRKAGYKNISIYTKDPIGEKFLFLSKNLAVGLTRKIFKKNYKLLFTAMAILTVIPNKILELIAPLIGVADTLLAIASNDFEKIK